MSNVAHTTRRQVWPCILGKPDSGMKVLSRYWFGAPRLNEEEEDFFLEKWEVEEKEEEEFAQHFRGV